MDIKELQENLNRLQNDIRSASEEFHRKTGMWPRISIEYTRVHQIGHRPEDVPNVQVFAIVQN